MHCLALYRCRCGWLQTYSTRLLLHCPALDQVRGRPTRLTSSWRPAPTASRQWRLQRPPGRLARPPSRSSICSSRYPLATGFSSWSPSLCHWQLAPATTYSCWRHLAANSLLQTWPPRYNPPLRTPVQIHFHSSTYANYTRARNRRRKPVPENRHENRALFYSLPKLVPEKNGRPTKLHVRRARNRYQLPGTSFR